MPPLNVEFLNDAALSNRVIVQVLTRVLLVCSQKLPEVWVKNISVGKKRSEYSSIRCWGWSKRIVDVCAERSVSLEKIGKRNSSISISYLIDLWFYATLMPFWTSSAGGLSGWLRLLQVNSFSGIIFQRFLAWIRQNGFCRIFCEKLNVTQYDINQIDR